MSKRTNGPHTQPWRDGLTFWACRDLYRGLRAIALLYGLGLVALLGTCAALLHRHDDEGAIALGVVFLGACYLPWGLVALIRLCGTLWHWRWLLVVLALLSGGCAEYSKNVAKLIGCDPVAVERGYCTTPAPAQEVKR